MRVISAAEQKKVIEMADIIEAVSTALCEYSQSHMVTPMRTVIPVSRYGGNALTMPASAEDIGCLGVKCVTVFPRNREKGKQTIHGVMLIFNVETGEPVALLEGSYLTVVRTGALSGLATQHLSRKDASVLCLIGTGAQARGVATAVMAVREIKEIRLVNRTASKAHDFAKELRKEYGAIDVRVVSDADEGVSEADIVVTATNSDVPVFSANALKPGAHVNAIGSFRPTMQEIPSEVIVQADKVVVESREAALEEAGDLTIPVEKGDFNPERIYAELGEIASRKKRGRESDDETTVFKSVGLAAADIVVAKEIYEKAIRAGFGQKVSL